MGFLASDNSEVVDVASVEWVDPLPNRFSRITSRMGPFLFDDEAIELVALDLASLGEGTSEAIDSLADSILGRDSELLGVIALTRT